MKKVFSRPLPQVRAGIQVRRDRGQPLRVPLMPRRECQPAGLGGFPRKAARAAETAAEQCTVRLGAAHSLKGAGSDQQRPRRGGDGMRAGVDVFPDGMKRALRTW